MSDFFAGAMIDLPATDGALDLRGKTKSREISREYQGISSIGGPELFHNTSVFRGHAALDEFIVGGTPDPNS